MTVVADLNGVVTGKFTIPPKIPAGIKRVTFTGANGSHGDAQFFGEGTLVTTTQQRVTNITTTTRIHYGWVSVDPLAQTFSLPVNRQLGAIELFVTAKGSTPIVVQIRNTSNGFPNQEILAEARLRPDQITVNAWNRWTLDNPVWAMANTELAIVVLCNDPDAAVGIAEMGKFDSVRQQWVTQQPYQIGVLLSSSNASTWTAHQDRDLCFRLLARKYTQAQKVINLGTIPIVDATDLLVMGMTDSPADGASAHMRVTMPNGSVFDVDGEQVIRLNSKTTGDVTLQAVLRSTENASGAIIPGSQLIVGTVQDEGDYVSRAIDGDATGCDIRVVFDAILPSGSDVEVYVAGVDEGDTWQAASQDGVAKPVGDGVHEYQYVVNNFTEARVRVKLVLSGTPAARPMVGNLRVSVT